MEKTDSYHDEDVQKLQIELELTYRRIEAREKDYLKQLNVSSIRNAELEKQVADFLCTSSSWHESITSILTDGVSMSSTSSAVLSLSVSCS